MSEPTTTMTTEEFKAYLTLHAAVEVWLRARDILGTASNEQCIAHIAEAAEKLRKMR